MTTLMLKNSVGVAAINAPRDVRIVQQLLNRFNTRRTPLLRIDGIAGPKTIAAIRSFQIERVHLSRIDGRVDPSGPTFRRLRTAPHTATLIPSGQPPAAVHLPTTGAPSRANQHHSHKAHDVIAWGAKVSPGFKRKVVKISERLVISPDFLMPCMAFESGETFSPSIRNAAGSGAVGLIQFMPLTAKQLHTSTADLATMSAEHQLDYVERYFLPYRGRIRTIEDIYMTILYPKAIGRPTDYPLFQRGTVAYRQNQGLDVDRDGAVRKYEAAAAVRAKYAKGLRPGFIG